MRKILILKFRAFFARFRLTDWLYIGLILLYLIPIWSFKYIPTQDGPSHLDNAQIIRQYSNPTYNYHNIYDLRLTPFPNWLYEGSLAGLMWVFPPLIAEKLLLSLYVISFPLAFLYFLGAVDPAKKPLGLLSFVFIYNYLFLMGLYNFVLSIPLAFLTLGYFWKHRFHLTLYQIIVLNLMILLVYFGHMVTFLVTAGSIAFIAIIQFINNRFSRHGGPLRRQITCLCISLLSFAPSFSLLVIYYLGSNFSGHVPILDIGQIPGLFHTFITMNILVSYASHSQIAVRVGVAFVFVLLFIITLIKRIARIGNSQRRLFRFEDCILGLFLIWFALYLLMPPEFGSAGFINSRLALLSSLFLLAWFDIPLPSLRGSSESNSPAGTVTTTSMPMQFRFNSSTQNIFLHETKAVNPRTWFDLAYNPALTILCCMASLAMLFDVIYSFSRAEPLLYEYTAGIEQIKPNTVILPLSFSTSSDYNIADPLINADHYYSITNGVVNLGNYEPFEDYFPLKIKSNLNLPIYYPYLGDEWAGLIEKHPNLLCFYRDNSMIDYLLVWDTPELFIQGEIERCYDLVFSNGRRKIYVTK
jgi:hypothetical protein